MLKPVIDRDGYSHVAISRQAHGKTLWKIHALVLTTFVGPRPEGMYGCHIDGDPSNNHVSNLYWGTPTQNVHDMIRHGRAFWNDMTHCKRGHDLTPAYIKSGGGRQCRICHNAWTRAKRAAVRAAKNQPT
jgi:hypothetical protein